MPAGGEFPHLPADPVPFTDEEVAEIISAPPSGEGLSTRAIAPIVGAHDDTVASDIKAQSDVGNPTPDSPVVEVAAVNLATGEILDQAEAEIRATLVEHTVTEKTRAVTGLDGKTYSAPCCDRAARRQGYAHLAPPRSQPG